MIKLKKIDIREMYEVEKGTMKLEPDTYQITATGSYISTWTGEKWIFVPFDENKHIYKEYQYYMIKRKTK